MNRLGLRASVQWPSGGAAAGDWLVGGAPRQDIPRILCRDYRDEVEALSTYVDRILDHEFDLLGSGPTRLGEEIDWHTDFNLRLFVASEPSS